MFSISWIFNEYKEKQLLVGNGTNFSATRLSLERKGTIYLPVVYLTTSSAAHTA
jgi:hypothetical protein